MFTPYRAAQIEGHSYCRTAFVHDNFVQAGGGERVAEELARLLPDADIFSTVSVPERLSPYMRSRGIRTTWLQRLPWMRQLYRHYFLLYPLAARSLRLQSYSMIVSSCYGFAKMIRKPTDAIHICYCHTPTRWIWRFEDYAARENFHPLVKKFLGKVVARLKRQDLKAAQAVDIMIANSTAVADRIRTNYGKDSEVIFPPIDCDRFNAVPHQEDYYLVVSRLVPYKRVDLAIEACQRLGKNLIIIGDGPDRARLQARSGSQVTFLGRAPDEVVTKKLAECRAVLFPGEEDFGMIPLEANASGRPCVAYGFGGSLDTVIDGVTGVLFLEPTAESLATALLRAEDITWDGVTLQRHARRFDRAVFAEKIRRLMDRVGARRFGQSLASCEDTARVA